MNMIVRTVRIVQAVTKAMIDYWIKINKILKEEFFIVEVEERYLLNVYLEQNIKNNF